MTETTLTPAQNIVVWERCRPACCAQTAKWGAYNPFDTPKLNRMLEEIAMRYEVRENIPTERYPDVGWAIWDLEENRQTGYWTDHCRAIDRCAVLNAMAQNNSLAAAGEKPNLADAIAEQAAAARREAEEQEPERFEGIA